MTPKRDRIDDLKDPSPPGGPPLLIVAWIVLVLGSGCKGASDSDAASTPAVAGIGDTTEIFDYTAHGVPSTVHPWTPKDYETAAEALARIVRKDGELLPRYGGTGQSGGLFARMVSSENFAMLSRRSVPVNQRMQMAVDFMAPQRRC